MARGSAIKRGSRWFAKVPVRRPDGTWTALWRRAVDEGFPDTKRGAEAACAKLLAEAGDEQPGAGRDLTVASWLAVVIAGKQIRGSTRDRYRRLAASTIAPYLGDVRLSDLTRRHVEAWHRQLEGRGLAPLTIKGAHTLLSGALSQAVEEGKLRRNPARAVGYRAEAAPARAWTPEEAAAFLAVTDTSDDAALCRLLVTTGLRIGEALALQWDQIDLARARLSVRRTVSRDEQGRVIVGEWTKTPSSMATVDLPASTVAALRQHQDRWRFRVGDEPSVFVSPQGRRLSYSTAHHRIMRYVALAGVPRLTPHGLRHTLASVSYALGEREKTIQTRLRHKGIAITADLYTHLRAEETRDAAARLDAALDALRKTGDEGADRASVDGL